MHALSVCGDEQLKKIVHMEIPMRIKVFFKKPTIWYSLFKLFIIQLKISHTLKTQNVQKEKNYEI